VPDVHIVWLPEARSERAELIDYIAERNVLAAFSVDDRISRQVDLLTAFPRLGRTGRIPGTFELVISQTPYILAYRLHGDELQILHVFHERRDWPPKH
jgi:toxin ParE1/3/4